MAERLDQALVRRGLIDSRERAQALIMEGRVYIFENKALKPSQKVEDSDEVTIRGELNPFVKPRRPQAGQGDGRVRDKCAGRGCS